MLECQEIGRDLGCVLLLGRHYYWARDYDRALEVFLSIQEIDPEFRGIDGAIDIDIAGVHNQAGRPDEAALAWLRAMELGGSPLLSAARQANDAAGMQGIWRIVLDSMYQANQNGSVRPQNFAILHGMLGEVDEAFAWLERAYEEREKIMILLGVLPQLDPLREDPRFDDLVRRVGIPIS